MTAAPLLVRWIAGDAARVRAALAAALGIEVPAGHSIAFPGLRLQIAEEEHGPGSRAADRLEVLGADPWFETAPTADDPTAAGTRFFALGWATVDLDRVAAPWAGVRWAAALRDSLVGARALLGRPDTTGAGFVRQELTVRPCSSNPIRRAGSPLLSPVTARARPFSTSGCRLPPLLARGRASPGWPSRSQPGRARSDRAWRSRGRPPGARR